MKNKVSKILFAPALLIALVIGICSCGSHEHEFSSEWTNDETSHWHAAVCEHTNEIGGKAAHAFGEGEVTTEPTEESAGVRTFTCSVCKYKKTEAIPPLEKEEHTHSYTEKTVAPTCASVGYTEYTCSCGDTYKDNYIDKTECEITEWTAVGDSTHTGVCALGHKKTVNCTFTESTAAPTCTESGFTEYVCSVCEYSYKDNYVAATGHDFKEEYEHDGSYHWHAAECGHDERSEYEPHVYVKTVVAPTCTKSGYTDYLCECGYGYTADYTAALGHTVSEWTLSSTHSLDASECKYTDTYTGVCDVCHVSETRDEIVEKHAFYFAVTSNATCVTSGIKTKICANADCKYNTPRDDSETLEYTDASAHTWTLDESASTKYVTAYKCSGDGCNETKRTILSTESEIEVDDSDLKDAEEITLPDATIGFDSAAKDNITGGGKVNISASTLDDDAKNAAIESAGLTEEQKASLEGKKVYSFNVTARGESIHELGGDAKVTLPYELSDGETPEFIVVWYLEEGKLTGIDAEYFEDAEGNGYVTFTTNHFSSYAISNLTPEQRCAKYGHSIVSFEPSCTSSSHDVCTVCNAVLNVYAPLGHSWHTVSTKPATCTENGSMEYSCYRCSLSFEQTLPAIGHHYRLDGYTMPTCTESGKSTYSCIYCDSSYSTSEPALGHFFILNIKDPTCTESGFTERTCKTCAEVIVSSYTPALGHTFGSEWWSAPDGHYHVCTVCASRGESEAHTPGAAATETEPEVCTVCGYVITPALGHTHTLTKTEAKAAGCLTGGNTEYYVCECGKWFADALGTQLITDRTSVFTDALGHNPENFPGKDATCTEDGYTAGLKCSLCGTVIRGNVTIPATGHKYTKAVTAPNCTEGGFTVYTCHCGDTYTSDETEPLGHKLTAAITAPSCTEGGYTEYTCSRCDYYAKDDATEPLSHSMSRDYTAVADGHFKTCTRCGEKTELEPHIGDYPEANEEHGIKCIVCSFVIEEAKDHVHTAKTKTDGKAPTCVSSGSYEYYRCSCGLNFKDEQCTEVIASLTEIILPALGHKSKVTAGKAPTCTEEGCTDSSVCSVCGEVLKASEKIDALGHELELRDGKAPTCTEGGYEAYSICKRCDYTTYKATPAAGHKEEIDARVEPTCTKTGLTAGSHCSVCGAVIIAQTEIPKAAHTYDDKYDESCNVCGFIRDAECAHTELETVTGRAPTCTEAGLTDGEKCKKCGEIITVQIEIAPLGHNSVTEEIREATCFAPGHYGKTTCSVCNTVLDPGIEIPMRAHAMARKETKEPTCTEDGYHINECAFDDCDYTETFKIEKLPHTYKEGVCTVCGIDSSVDCAHKRQETVIGKEATCWDDGLTSARVCTDCGKIIKPAEVIPAAHKTVRVDALEPTCTEYGHTAYEYCTVCDEITVPKKDIPALDHLMETVNLVNPTCTESGFIVKECTREGCDYADKLEIEALGHNYNEDGICQNCNESIKDNCEHEIVIEFGVAPTCQTEGRTERHICTICNTVLKEAEIIPMIPHEYDTNGVCIYCKEVSTECIHKNAEIIIKAYPTCTMQGEKEISCPDCGMVRIEIIAPIGHSFVDGKCSNCGESSGIPDCYHMDNVIYETKAPTCTDEGIREYHCTKCGHIRIETIEPYGHKFEDGKCLNCGESDGTIIECKHENTYEMVLIAPSCTAEGLMQIICKDCQFIVADVPMSPVAHNFADGKCIWCGKSDGSGDTEECKHENVLVMMEVPATCTETGLSSYEICADCKIKLTEPVVLPTIGHVFEGSPMRCTYCGLIAEGEEISIFDANEIGKALRVTITTNDTYFVTGVITRITSTKYGNLYIADENGNEIFVYGINNFDETLTEGDTIVLNAHIAKYVDEWDNTTIELTDCELIEGDTSDMVFTPIKEAISIASTLSNAGSTEYEYVIGGTVGEIVNDIYGNLYITSEDGLSFYVYGLYDEKGVKYGDLDERPELGSYLKIRTKIYKYVTAKGEIIIEGKNAVIVDFYTEECKHENYVSIEYVSATCIEDGYERFMCTSCDYMWDVIKEPAYGHNFIDGECTYCGESDGTVTECQHEKVEKIVMTEPTCNISGMLEYRCYECGISWTEHLPPVDHSFVDGKCIYCGESDGSGVTEECTHENADYLMTIAPTCTMTGKREKSCPNCGAVTVEIIPALGHNFSNGKCVNCGESDGSVTECQHEKVEKIVMMAPTCNMVGACEYRCYDCGISWMESLPLVEHDFVDGKCVWCDIITAAYANTVGGGISISIDSVDTFTVTATVAEILNEKYGKMNVVDSNGDTLLVYGLKSPFTLPTVGDEITLSGNLCKYVGTDNSITLEMKNGVILTEGETGANTVAELLKIAGEFSGEGTDSAIYTVLGTVDEVVNTKYGNLYLTDEEGNRLYIYGLYTENGTRYDGMDVPPEVGNVIIIEGSVTKYIKSDNTIVIEIKNATLKEIVA